MMDVIRSLTIYRSNPEVFDDRNIVWIRYNPDNYLKVNIKLGIKNIIKRTRKEKEKELLDILESYMTYIKFDKEFSVRYINFDIDENNELLLKHKIKDNKDLNRFLEIL